MPFNGSGTFTRVHDWTTDQGNSIDIQASRMDEEDDGFATGLTTCLTKDGQTNPTANLPMAGFAHTGVGNATARNQYAAVGQIQDQSFIWAGTAGGTANALTLTPSPAITAYAAGQSFVFKAGSSANSAATTVAISGLSTIAVQYNGAACIGGEIQANKWYRVTLDSTSTAQLEAISSQLPFIDSIPVIRGSSDNTKQVRFEVDGLTTGTTRVITVPDSDFTIAKASDIPTVPSAATQSDQETATSTTTYVSPGRQQYHPGMAKAWVLFQSDGTVTSSYNVTSVTKNGTGDYRVTFTTAFSSANYVAVGMNQSDGSIGYKAGGTKSTTVCDIVNRALDGTLTDAANASIVFFGDQ